MSSIPANLSRVPNLLRSTQLLDGINKTNLALLQVQTQLASGEQVGKYSDDPIAASAISVLLQKLSTGNQLTTNLTAAQGTLNFLDSSIGDATDLIRQASSIASGQIGVTSDAATRNNQATVVDGAISQLFQIANRQINGVYVFGGATSNSPPLKAINGGYEYVGQGTGQYADLGSASDVPITIGGDNAIGSVSARVQSTIDLNPTLTPSTALSDLSGATGQGIASGSLSFSFGGGPTATVDLSKAATVQDVQTALTSAIKQYETANNVTILGPGGVSTSGGSLSIDVVSGTPSNPQLTFTDAAQSVVGKDLGLTQSSFSATSPTGTDLNPKLTPLTPLSAIPGLTVPPGTIRFSFTSGSGTSVTDVDLSSATNIDQLRNLIETQVPGVAVQINSAGTGIDVLNKISGPALSIAPTGTTVDTASQLGIRTLDGSTPISALNNGKGVGIIDNQTDPVSGLKTHAANSDFRVVLGNGQAFDVDLRPQDLGTVQSVIDRINSEFTSAISQPPVVASAPPLAAGQFTAGLPTAGNGIQFSQTVSGGALSVQQLNNSPALQDLGLANGTASPSGATFTAQDTGAVSVNNLFTALITLRDSLRSNSNSGITLAGNQLTSSLDQLSGTQALVGVYANRVTAATTEQASENTMNEQMRSQLQDLDYTSASIKFNTLRTQLQAAYQSTSIAQNLSLLDFLK